MSDLERMAEGFVRLSAALQRRKGELGGPAAELTTTQAIALRTVVREGPLRMGALADVLGTTVATASRTADALAARGLVAREPDPDDARCVRVAPTAAGTGEYAARRERFLRALDALANELSEPERARLADALDTLAELFA